MFGEMIFSQTFWRMPGCAKSAWWTEVPTVVRNLTAVVTSRSSCGASDVAISTCHTSFMSPLRKGSNSSSYFDM